jgi:hypothetical protein
MKQRKIQYVPGMISLILLPILCVWYLNEHKNVERVIEFHYPVKYHPHDINILCSYPYDTSCLSLPYNRRKYCVFKLNGNSVDDSLLLIKFNEKLQHIVQSEDTISGLQVTFGDSVQYKYFIKTINICLHDTFLPIYTVYEDNLWYFHRKHSPKFKKTTRDNYIKYKNGKLNNQKIKHNISQDEKKIIAFWPFFLVFIGFSLISIRYIRNIYTNNK